jgi:UDP-N-acetylglucosamine:LPS N-acetylglucosamine transferase
MTRNFLVPLGSGGYASEVKQILDHLDPKNKFVYLTPMHAKSPENLRVHAGPCYSIPQFQTFTQRGYGRDFSAFIGTFFKTIKIIKKYKSDIVLCVAIRHSVPILLAAQIAGCRTIFVESLTRVRTPSNTAKIVYRLKLAQEFYVQWPQLRKFFPKSQVATII